MEEAAEQHENSIDLPLEKLKDEERKKKAEWLAPYQYKKGQSGNPSGRPPGISLKEYARNKLLTMTEEEREEFLHGINKREIWEMAKSRPKQDTDITSKGEAITPLLVKFIDDAKPSDGNTS